MSREDQDGSTDVIDNPPKTVGVIPIDKMSLYHEYKKILASLKSSFMTAKDIHMLYFDDATRSFTKGQKTIYRYIHKLLDEGLIIEVGHRDSPSSRVNETLYGPFAKVIFYEGPEIMEQWKSEEKMGEIQLMHLLVQKQLDRTIDFDEFYDFALSYLEDQDQISSELLEHADDPDIMEILQQIPTKQISHLVFFATNLAILASQDDELR